MADGKQMFLEYSVVSSHLLGSRLILFFSKVQYFAVHTNDKIVLNLHCLPNWLQRRAVISLCVQYGNSY